MVYLSLDPEAIANRSNPRLQGHLKAMAFLREWDPIGVCPNDFEPGEMPFDEYDSYSNHLIKLLDKRAEVEEILDYLRTCATVSMGLSHFDESHSKQMAEKLVAWWDEWKIRERQQ